jgi:hypothetical protein
MQQWQRLCRGMGRRLVLGGAGEHAAPVAGAAALFGYLVVFQLGCGRRGEFAVPEEVPEQRKDVQVACRAWPCFQGRDVRDKRILSVFLSWLSAAPARRTAQGGRVALCRRAPTVSAGSPAVRLSGLRWWRPSAGELRNVVEVAGFA